MWAAEKGLLTASLFLGLLFAAACASPPSTPTRPSTPSTPTTPTTPTTSPPSPSPATAADFAGIWSGTWVVSTTTIPWVHVGGERQFLLRLRRSGDRLEGYLVAHGAMDDVLTGDVAGTVQFDYRLLLEGSTPAASADDAHGAVTFHLAVWFSAGTLQGTLDYEVQRPYSHWSFAYDLHELSSGTLTSAARGPDPSDTFDGTWQGRYLVRTCDFSGWDNCYLAHVNDTAQFLLTLSQTGGQVTGTMGPSRSPGPIPVTGDVTGKTLRLSGSLTEPGTTTTLRLLTFSATRDLTGRLTGGFTWAVESVGTGNMNYGQVFLTTQSVTLYSVVQVR